MISYILSALILGISILGARLISVPVLYTALALVLAGVIYGTIKKNMSHKQYYVLIACIGLGLLFQTTLQTNYIVGTDIHYEYYYAQLTYNSGFWNHSLPYSYNSAVGITVFAPVLAKVLHVDLVWIFKVVFPMMLAGVPVLLYYIYNKNFNKQTSFLAVMFMIIVPTFTLELTGIAKQEMGELFMIASLALVTFSTLNKWLRLGLIALFAILAAISHYSVGSIMFFYLVGCIPLLFIGKYLLKLKTNINAVLLSVTVVIIIGTSALFYSWAANGKPLQEITQRVRTQLYAMNLIKEPEDVSVIKPFGSGQSPDPFAVGDNPTVNPDSPTLVQHWNYPEPAVAVALGEDFMSVNWIAKVFRILQYITEFIILIGCILILIRYKKYSVEYLAMFLLAGLLLVLCVFLPGFSPILNASRFYHLSLLFLAPAFAIGGLFLLRNYKILLLVVFIPYFLFTQGIVFEVAKADSVSNMSIPYAHSLSAKRLDTTGLFTSNDIKARDWLVDNKKFPMTGDMWGSTLVAETQGDFGYLVGINYFYYVNIAANVKKDVPDDNYIFLRERNEELQQLTFYTGIGLRANKTYNEFELDKILRGREVVFQAGDAKVYGPRSVLLP